MSSVPYKLHWIVRRTSKITKTRLVLSLIFHTFRVVQREMIRINNDRRSTQVPHCDGHNCNHLWLCFVAMRLVLESFKSLDLASSFWDFCDGQLFHYKNQKPKCNHLWRFCDSLKAVTMKTVIESFKSPSLAGFFVTICDHKVLFHGAGAQILTKNKFKGHREIPRLEGKILTKNKFKGHREIP
jgi:hypothetical protein